MSKISIILCRVTASSQFIVERASNSHAKAWTGILTIDSEWVSNVSYLSALRRRIQLDTIFISLWSLFFLLVLSAYFSNFSSFFLFLLVLSAYFFCLFFLLIFLIFLSSCSFCLFFLLVLSAYFSACSSCVFFLIFLPACSSCLFFLIVISVCFFCLFFLVVLSAYFSAGYFSLFFLGLFPALFIVCSSLQLLAANVSGSSKYCAITTYKTLSEAPSKIEKPRLVGKAKTHSFTLTWGWYFHVSQCNFVFVLQLWARADLTYASFLIATLLNNPRPEYITRCGHIERKDQGRTA